jgi:hypothetical protein
VRRPFNVIGAGVSYDVLVNGSHIGTVDNNSVVVLDAPAGRCQLWVEHTYYPNRPLGQAGPIQSTKRRTDRSNVVTLNVRAGSAPVVRVKVTLLSQWRIRIVSG